MAKKATTKRARQMHTEERTFSLGSEKASKKNYGQANPRIASYGFMVQDHHAESRDPKTLKRQRNGSILLGKGGDAPSRRRQMLKKLQ